MKIKVGIYESPERAPRYGAESRYLNLETVNIVDQGMESGAPTVDLVMKDRDGNQYTTLVPASFIRSIYSICEKLDPGGDMRKITLTEN